MGIKINKTKIKLAILGLSLIGLSVAGLSYVTSKGVENRVYKMSFQTLPEGSLGAGLAIKFNKEDISCSGLVKFDCTIKNVSLYNPKTKLNIFKAKKAEIGTFSKRGIRLGNIMDVYANITNIEPHEDFEEWNNLTDNKKKLKEDMFPFNLSGSLKVNYSTNKESKGIANLKIESKVMDFNVKTTLLTLLSNNIKKLRKEDLTKSIPDSNIFTIVNDFEISLVNKNFESLLHNIYLNEYMNVDTEIEKKKVNLKFIGIESSKKLSLLELKEELSKKITSFSGDKNLENFINELNVFFSKNNMKIVINGKNKNFYTINEILKTTVNQSKFGQLEFFDIIIKTGENK